MKKKRLPYLFIFLLFVGCDYIKDGCSEACPLNSQEKCISDCAKAVKPYWIIRAELKANRHIKDSSPIGEIK